MPPSNILAMLRFIASLTIAFALFLSPMAMANGGAAAMAHDSGGPAMAMSDHCAPPHKAPHHKADIKLSCAAACAALSPAPLGVDEGLEVNRLPASMAAPRVLAGIGPDRETPPPRAIQQS